MRGRTWRRFLLGVAVLLIPTFAMVLENPKPENINPIVTFLSGAILGYLIGWWITAERLV